MPFRRLTSRYRSRTANVCLAAILAFTAGEVDVSGYLGLRQFTSHMSGTTASLAAALAANTPEVLTKTGVVLLSFLCGAVACALLVNFSRRREREGQFALPLLLEAILLLIAAALGNMRHTAVLPTLGILAFAMGLQNAIITKISDAEIRTTHVTGMVTDIGIEVGRALYWNRNQTLERVRVRPERLAVLVLLVLAFFIGGLIAASTFYRFRFAILIPLAVFLGALTISPLYIDLRVRRERRTELS